MKGFTRILGPVLAAMMFLAGCSSMSPEKSVTENEADNEIEIGICFDSFVIERWERDREEKQKLQKN